MRRLIARFANGVHFHSQSALSLAENTYSCSLRDKAIVTAHASYPDDYPSDRSRTDWLREETAIEDGNFTFLFFGNIRRYKGLEALVDAFGHRKDPNIRLLIAGAPISGVSTEWLQGVCKRDRRIRLRLGFISSLDVAALFEISDVLVAPYIATLTSGVVSLGLTFGIPMVLPEAAKVYDLPGEAGAEYFTPDNLSDALARVEKRDLSMMRSHNTQLGKSLTWEGMARTIAMAYRKASRVR